MIGCRSEPLRWAAADAAGRGGDEKRAAVLRTNDDIVTSCQSQRQQLASTRNCRLSVCRMSREYLFIGIRGPHDQLSRRIKLPVDGVHELQYTPSRSTISVLTAWRQSHRAPQAGPRVGKEAWLAPNRRSTCTFLTTARKKCVS